MKANIRYGVVNSVIRDAYEKDFQVSFGYEFITRDERKAIIHCKALKDESFIVEKIYDDPIQNNMKEEIFRNQGG